MGTGPTWVGGVVVGLLVAACSVAPAREGARPAPAGVTVPATQAAGVTARDVPAGPLEAALAADVTALASAPVGEGVDTATLGRVVDAGDARVGWLLSDLLRFAQDLTAANQLTAAFDRLTGSDFASDRRGSAWVPLTDQLIVWDLPAWPGYVADKARLFLQVEPGWAPFFDDGDSAIDWRLVSWGGVLIDDRPLGDGQPCPEGCIPALDDPAVTAAAGGAWYPDDAVVFGVVVGGEALALPKNQMEVHEMVNLTLGGRRLGIPYCTLCGSAQAYFLDGPGVDGTVLRTSGLLSRSNKVMYDLTTRSVLDTFTGAAKSGPLHDAGVTLPQTTVVASTWGQWKADHPATRIVARDGGIGRSYPADPLRGRDDDGPIFPIGPVDPRLPVQEPVVGVTTAEGTPVAFPVEPARRALEQGLHVAVQDVRAVADGDGLRVVQGGTELPAHQAFWFAWSQFNPGTIVWSGPAS